MSGELHQISVAIGALQADMQSAKESRRLMHERMERLDEGMERVIAAVEAGTAAIGAKLDRHIADDDKQFAEIKEKRLPPVERHVDRVRLVVRFGKWTGSVLGFGGIAAIWHWFKDGGAG